MSGAEAIAVLGVISSIISIVDGTKQLYDAATNAQGLPEAFREVAARLPIVQNVLAAAKRHIEKGNTDEDSYKGAKNIVERCGNKAEKLEELFKEVMPANSASRAERYLLAAKTLGKGSRVEALMKGMLEDIQLLAINYGLTAVTDTQRKDLADAIRELAALPPSIPEHAIEGTGFTAIHSGSGSINQAQRDLYSGSGPVYHAQSMNFGSQGQKDDETEACLRALFLTDPRDDREKLVQIKGSIVKGTCEWIKGNALYSSWLGSYSQLLWLSGGPGKGKTMLSIFLAEELERVAHKTQDTLFLQYFCDNKDEKRNTAITIIRGLVFQLVQFRPELVDYLLPSFKIQREALFTGSSFETLWRCFKTMLRTYAPGIIYCILDGLDECDSASLEPLLGKLTGLFSTSTYHLKLIVVSRDYPDLIPEILSTFPRIRLDPDADKEVNGDIHRFIETKIDELSIQKQYPKPLQERVQGVFQERAQGTFLWVGIVARQLRKFKITEVEKALDLFPAGLEELYARMLLQINLDRRDTAARILRWVVMAIRPLTIAELSVAINADSSMSFSPDKIIRDQISYCGDLLTIKQDEVSLIHQSTKDYLLRKTPDPNPELEFFRVKEKVGNLEIVRKSLDYLQRNSSLEGKRVDLEDVVHSRAFPLFSYATLYWPEHARALAWSDDVFDLSHPFYQRDSLARESWLKTCWPMKVPTYPPTAFTLLHLASCFGILPLVETILNKKGLINKVKRRHDLNKKDSFGGTALYWAARSGHAAVMRLLLEKGADIKAEDQRGRTALEWALSGGHKTVSRLLLEKSHKYKGIGLHRASLAGDEIMIRQLLEKGADVEAKGNHGWTALHCAAEGGHDAVARQLLEKGADVEAKGNHGWTALHCAAQGGHNAVARQLLEKGADVEAKGNHGWTALHCAAEGGHDAVARQLLEKGADVEAKGNHGWTALHFAAEGGHDAVARQLLEKGADVEAKGNHGWTALHFAAQGGHNAVARQLLEKGADVEAKDNHGWTALHCAAEGGHDAVAQLLTLASNS